MTSKQSGWSKGGFRPGGARVQREIAVGSRMKQSISNETLELLLLLLFIVSSADAGMCVA